MQASSEIHAPSRATYIGTGYIGHHNMILGLVCNTYIDDYEDSARYMHDQLYSLYSRHASR
jgi:hypothetical protein